VEQGRLPGAVVRVVVVDTDSGFLAVLAKRIERRGWQSIVGRPPVSPDDLVALRAGALVLDLAAFAGDGWAELERICTALPWLPVIVCTGPSTVSDRVRGLRLGADDWLSKPCHPEEVLARLEATVRRQRHAEAIHAVEAVLAGELEIRSDQFQAYAGNRSADLTRREFELLELLAQAEGRVLEREEIYRRVWGYAMARGDRSVDVFVRKVRHKLARVSPEWTYIHTHFGVGYRFAAEPADARDAEPEVEEPAPADDPLPPEAQSPATPTARAAV
jgi:DNA-binding response OmpR family regulator